MVDGTALTFSEFNLEKDGAVLTTIIFILKVSQGSGRTLALQVA